LDALKPTAGTSCRSRGSIVLKLEGNVGHIEGFNGKDVPLQDRFFKGADSFRGFAQSGVGPRQIGNDGETDAIGAQSCAIATPN
jgi:outer membrane protein insertion porin family